MSPQHSGAQLTWVRSTRCSPATANCVEIARGDDTVFMRDSKDPSGDVLIWGGAAWREFLAAIRTGGPAPIDE